MNRATSPFRSTRDCTLCFPPLFAIARMIVNRSQLKGKWTAQFIRIQRMRGSGAPQPNSIDG